MEKSGKLSMLSKHEVLPFLKFLNLMFSVSIKMPYREIREKSGNLREKRGKSWKSQEN